MTLQGTYTALITPFQSDLELDKESLIRMIDLQIKAQVEGIVILGTTAEVATLSLEEKKYIIETTVAQCKGTPTKVMVGAGTNYTKTTIEQIQLFEKMGVDSFLLITPYYNKPPQEGIYNHFAEAAKASFLPICLYNIPGRTSVNMEAETVSKLMDIENILSIKEASGNFTQINSILAAAKEKKNSFTVLSGEDSLIAPMLSIGCKGVISATANIAPKQVKELIDTQNTKLHFQLLPLFKAMSLSTNPIPIKHMLFSKGLIHTPLCRSPLCPMDEKGAEFLTHFIKTNPQTQ